MHTVVTNATAEGRLAARWWYEQRRYCDPGWIILAEMEDEAGRPVDVKVGEVRYEDVAALIVDQHNAEVEDWARQQILAEWDAAKEEIRAEERFDDFRAQRYFAIAGIGELDLFPSTAILKFRRS